MHTRMIAAVFMVMLGACSRERSGDAEQSPVLQQQSQASPAAAPRLNDRTSQASELQPVAGDDESREAKFDLKTAEGVDLDAEAKLVDTGSGVNIVLTVEDALPGKRGVHVHEKGDCSDIRGRSMGTHYNPEERGHALPPGEDRHLGDLGNIEIDKDGKGRLEITVARANLRPNDRLSFVGRALVIHEGEDTGKGTDGEAGTPIACGVIEAD